MSIFPKESAKGYKTTLIAIISLFLIIACFIALFTKVITGDELSTLITGITAASVVVLGLFTKDSDKTGTDEKSNI
jgi:uncharacterized membrane protein